MTKRRAPVVIAVCGLASAASAQGLGLALRFSNDKNYMVAAPGTTVPVELWAEGLPSVGTPIAWTTPPGTGQIGAYAGFSSVLLNITGMNCTWLPPTPASIPSQFMGPPFGNPGTAAGSNVNGISIGVGFHPPVTGNSILLWTGSFVVDALNVYLSTSILPLGNHTGIEVQLSGIVPANAWHVLPAANGTARIEFPAPASVALFGFAGLAAARRRR